MLLRVLDLASSSPKPGHAGGTTGHDSQLRSASAEEERTSQKLARAGSDSGMAYVA